MTCKSIWSQWNTCKQVMDRFGPQPYLFNTCCNMQLGKISYWFPVRLNSMISALFPSYQKQVYFYTGGPMWFLLCVTTQREEYICWTELVYLLLFQRIGFTLLEWSLIERALNITDASGNHCFYPSKSIQTSLCLQEISKRFCRNGCRN